MMTGAVRNLTTIQSTNSIVMDTTNVQAHHMQAKTLDVKNIITIA